MTHLSEPTSLPSYSFKKRAYAANTELIAFGLILDLPH
jgi:hypothetical protein